MKIFCMSCLLVLSLAEVKGQNTQNEKKSRINLHVTGDYISIHKFGQKSSFGLLGEYYLTDNLSSLFPISIGDKYYHVGLGTLFGPLGLLSLRFDGVEFESFSEFFGFCLVMATVVESMGYHIHIDQEKEIIPYYSLFRMRGVGTTTERASENGYASGSIGVMLRYHLGDKFHLNGYAEYSHFYWTHVNGIQAGLTLAYAF